MKRDLAHELRRGTLSLEKAIFSGALIPRALHTFACDCAARAILCEERQYRSLPELLIEAIATKRDWIDELCKQAVMEKARDKALASLREQKRRRVPWGYTTWSSPSFLSAMEGQSNAHAAQAAIWAISLDGEDAAENAARESCEAIVYALGVTREQEQAWQRRRLAFLHELAPLTRRMWLASDETRPLPIERPDDVALGAFDA